DPPGFQHAVLGEAHQDRIESTRLEICFLAELVTVMPGGWASGKDFEKQHGLRGETREVHGANIYLCRGRSQGEPQAHREVGALEGQDRFDSRRGETAAL